MTDKYAQLKALFDQLPRGRRQFEMEVEQAAIEIIVIAKQISTAIGDISAREAKDAIIREFAERLR